jgi:rhodanese-related sulfurtransferase
VQFHISGATLIPLEDLPNRLNEIPKDREVVVVCRTGHRSAQGRDILTQAGFTNVTSMAGGMTEWQAQGLPDNRTIFCPTALHQRTHSSLNLV